MGEDIIMRGPVLDKVTALEAEIERLEEENVRLRDALDAALVVLDEAGRPRPTGGQSVSPARFDHIAPAVKAEFRRDAAYVRGLGDPPHA